QVAPFGSSASESTEEERSLSGTSMGLPLPASPTTSTVSSTVSSVSTPVHSAARAPYHQGNNTNRSPHPHHQQQQKNHLSPTASSIHRTRQVSPIKGESTAGQSHKANAESAQKSTQKSAQQSHDHKAGLGSAGGGRLGFRGGVGGVGAGGAGGGGESAGVGNGGARGRRVSVGGVGEQWGRGVGSVSGREVRTGVAGGGGGGGGESGRGGGGGGGVGGGGAGGAAGGSFKGVGTRGGRRASVSGGYVISKGEDGSSFAKRRDEAFGKGGREEAQGLHSVNPFETSHKIPRENPSGSHKIQQFLDAGGVSYAVVSRSAQHGVGGDERLDGFEAGGQQSSKIQEFLDAGGVSYAVVSRSAQHGVGDGDDERLEAARHRSRKIQEFLDAGGVADAATAPPASMPHGVGSGDERLGGSGAHQRQPRRIQEFLDAGGLPGAAAASAAAAAASAASAAADRSNKGSHACAGADSFSATAPGVDSAKAAAGVDSDTCVTPPAAASVSNRGQPVGVSGANTHTGASASGAPTGTPASTTQTGASASGTHVGVSGAGGILGGMTGFGMTFDWSKAVATAGGGAGSRAATVVEAMNKVSDWIGSFSGLEESLSGGGGGRRAVEYGGDREEAGGEGNGVGSEEEGRRDGGRVGSGERGSEGSEGSGEGRGAGVQRVGSGQISGWSEDEEGEGESHGGGRKSNGAAVPSLPSKRQKQQQEEGVDEEDDEMVPSLPSKQQKRHEEEGGDEEDDEMVVMESVNGRHTAMQHMLQGRLSAVRHVAALWVDGELLPALSALAASKDLAVVADVLEVLAMQGGRRLVSVGMEGALQLQPLLRALLASSHSKYVGVALSLLRELLRAFSEPITAARTATHSPGVDLHMEERLQRCNDCYEGFRVLEDQLHPILRRRSNENYALASDVHMLLQKMQ
ncbi:unnamed protein product, partial [Closterium sp. Yama58-4]